MIQTLTVSHVTLVLWAHVKRVDTIVSMHVIYHVESALLMPQTPLVPAVEIQTQLYCHLQVHAHAMIITITLT